MALPKGYRPREGDILIIHAECLDDTEPGDHYIHVKLGREYRDTFTIPIENIIDIKNRRWIVGEIVNWRPNRDIRGTIVAVVDNEVVIKLTHSTNPLSGVTPGGHKIFNSEDLELFSGQEQPR